MFILLFIYLSLFDILGRLTVVAHAFHHDFGLGKLIPEAQLARHVAGRIQVHLQPVGAQTRLHRSTALLILTSCVDHMPRQADPVCVHE